MTARSCIVAAIFLTCSSGAASAESRPLKERFLSEYSDSFRRLEKLYTHVDLTEETTGPGAKAKYGGTMTFRWRSQGTKFRDDLISLSGAIAQSKISRGDLSCRVYASSQPILAKVQRGDKYAITEIHGRVDQSLVRVARVVSPRLVFVPYCVNESNIMELINMPNVEVRSFGEIEPGKASLKYVIRGEGGRTLDSEFVFDTTRCWAVISHANRRFSTQVEYGDSIDGVPIAKRLTHYWNGDFKTPAFVSELKEINPGPIPEETFTLAEFGLPEIPETKQPGFPIFASLGLLGLIFSLVLGWFLRWRGMRKVDLRRTS